MPRCLHVRMTSWGIAVGVAWLTTPTAVSAQSVRDVIQGQVADTTGRIVRGARVLVTRGPDRMLFHAESDSLGAFRIVVDSGTGDYLLYVDSKQSPPLLPFRRRLTRQSPADTVFTVAVRLVPQGAPQQLAVVTVREARPTPRRDDDAIASVGAQEYTSAGSVAAVSPDARGRLDALAATLAGVTTTPAGPSVLGLPASQNQTTLNGLAFAGAAVPRAAEISARVVTSSYDPSRGWFGGAETRVALSQDFVYDAASTSSLADVATVRGALRVSQDFGQTGTAMDGRLSYNLSGQVGSVQQRLRTPSLRDLAQALQTEPSDTALSGLLSSAFARGLVVTPPSQVRTQQTDAATLLLGVSSTSLDPATFTPRRSISGLTAYLSRERTAGTAVDGYSFAGTSGSQTRTAAALQGAWSRFSTPQRLTDFRSGVTISDQSAVDGTHQPNVLVLAGASNASAGSAVPISLGGSASPSTGRTLLTWDSELETRFFPTSWSSHRLHLSLRGRFDSFKGNIEPSAYPFYFYPSVRSFLLNEPGERVVTRGGSRQLLGTFNGAAALGDYWRARPSLELLYGVRVEGMRLLNHPLTDSVVAQLGRRSLTRLDNVHISPRLGFVWSASRGTKDATVFRSDYGVFPRPRVGVLKGGIGEFRPLLTPEELAWSIPTSRSGTTLDVERCTGGGIPVPTWPAGADALGASVGCQPTQSGSGEGNESATTHQFLDTSWRVPSNWRGNLSWTQQSRGLMWSVEGVYAVSQNQPSRDNVNFSNQPVFALPSENDRTVYVPLSAINPNSGAVLGAGSRVRPALGSVFSLGSRGALHVKQLSVLLSPDLSNLSKLPFFASIGYAWTAGTSTQSGFDATTWGSPRDRFTASNALISRHSLVLQGGLSTRYLVLSVFARAASGLPFTPVVGTDINGDGLANDRAFVFDPAHVADPHLSASLRALLSAAPSYAGRCIRRQLGAVAIANGCEGPWSLTSNARLQLRPGFLPGWARRVDAAVQVTNLAGAIARVTKMRDDRYWSIYDRPYPVLLLVDGFDPVARAFKYKSNPLFGQRQIGVVDELRAPRLSLEVRIDLGAPRDQQILDRTLAAGRNGHPGKRRTAAETKRFYMRALPDPFQSIFALSDSLLLTPDQVRAAMEGQRRFNARKDVTLTALSSWLAELPDSYDPAEALQRQTAAFTEVLNAGREEVQAALRDLLNPLQKRMLPWPASVMMNASAPLSLRDIQR